MTSGLVWRIAATVRHTGHQVHSGEPVATCSCSPSVIDDQESPCSLAHPEKAPNSFAASSATLPTGSGPRGSAPSVCPDTSVLTPFCGEPHLQVAAVHAGTDDPMPGQPGRQGEETTIRRHRHDQIVAVP